MHSYLVLRNCFGQVKIIFDLTKNVFSVQNFFDQCPQLFKWGHSVTLSSNHNMRVWKLKKSTSFWPIKTASGWAKSKMTGRISKILVKYKSGSEAWKIGIMFCWDLWKHWVPVNEKGCCSSSQIRNSSRPRICVKHFLSFSQKNLAPEKTETNFLT